MNAIITDVERPTWRQINLKKSGTFISILAINVSLLLILGSRVIYHFVVEHVSDPITTFKIKTIPPPPKPPSHGGTVAKSMADPTINIAPPKVDLPSIVTSANSSLFKVNSVQTISFNSTVPSFTSPAGSGLGAGTSGGGVPQANPFGGTLQDAGTPALVGYFYDLKQYAGDTPTPSGISMQGWRKVMDQLVADNLNEGDLSRYFKSSDPRSTNGFSIPEQESENAPAAFGLAGQVQPNLWAIIYKGKASVPKTGRFRFVGFGDDVLYIRLNGRNVLDAGYQSLTKNQALHETYPYVWSGLVNTSGLLRKGEWFDVQQGDIIDLQILIGDWGGKCGYFLLLEEDGATYEKGPDGITPKLPLFQVGAKLPVPHGPETPPASDSDVVWPAVNDQL